MSKAPVTDATYREVARDMETQVMITTADQALANFAASPNGPAQAVTDSPANVIADLVGLLALQTAGQLTSVNLTAPLTAISAAQAAALFKLNSITSGSINQLLITGGNTVSAAQAAAIAAVPGLNFETGATLAVSDTLANLLLPSNAAGLAKAKSITITGTNNTITAAQAVTLLGGYYSTNSKVSLAAGATLTIADSAVNIASSALASNQPDYLSNRTNIVLNNNFLLATKLLITGTDNTLTPPQISALSGFPALVVAPGSTLSAFGSAPDLVRLSNPGLALVTSVRLTGQIPTQQGFHGKDGYNYTPPLGNIVTVAEATKLSLLPNFSLTTGAQLLVLDTATNLLTPGAFAGIGIATSLSLLGTATVAQAAILLTLAGFDPRVLVYRGTYNDTYTTFAIADEAANLLSAGNSNSVAKATTVQLVGLSNTVSAAQGATLVGMANFGLASGASLTVADSANMLLASANAAGIAKASNVQLTGTGNTATLAQAAVLFAMPNFGLAANATLAVTDTAATLSANLANLQRLALAGSLTSISPTDGQPLIISAQQLNVYSLVLSKLVGSYIFSSSTVTVQGFALSIPFDNGNAASISQALLAPFNDGLNADNIVAARAGAAPPVAGGKNGILEVDSAGQYAIDAGYSALVDAATVPATVFGGTSNGQLVVAGAGGLAFAAGSGAGTVIAGDGNNLISVYPGGGAQNVITGNGANTIVFLAGNNSATGGTGSNQILAQGGNNLIISAGTDLINAPSGNATVNAGTNNPTIFFGSGASQFNGRGNATVVVGSAAATLNSQGNSQLWMQAGGGVVNSSGAATVIGGTGATTVNAASGNNFVFAGPGNLNFVTGTGVSTILGNAGGTASLIGGAGSLIDIGYGSTNFVGGTGADTIAAFGGSATITGGSGTGVYLGAPGGHNHITGGSGRVTILGGGDGDVLAAGSGAGDIIKAGGGAETISALGTSGTETFYGGTGNDLFLLGSGTTQLLVGTGSETIVAGTGTELFAIASGVHSNVVIQNFTSGKDFISLVGFATDAATTAINSAVIASGSESLTLSDGTQILFQNFTGLTTANFV